MKNIFISFPYTHKDELITLIRVHSARQYAMQLVANGYAVFSPAIFGHDLIHELELNKESQDMTFKYWEPFCYSYLKVCDELHLLTLDGYKESIGCGGEMLQAKMLGIPVYYVDKINLTEFSSPYIIKKIDVGDI